MTLTRPGYGDHAHVRNPITGKEWLGEVLGWVNDAPQIRDDETGELRYFPPHWVVEVQPGEGPPPTPADEHLTDDSERHDHEEDDDDD